AITIGPGREWTLVIDPVLFHERTAGAGVFEGCVVRGDKITARELDSSDRRRLHWNRLRRERELSWHAALGHRPLFHAKNRLAGFAIEQVDVAGLGGQRERWNRAAVTPDLEQSR